MKSKPTDLNEINFFPKIESHKRFEFYQNVMLYLVVDISEFKCTFDTIIF